MMSPPRDPRCEAANGDQLMASDQSSSKLRVRQKECSSSDFRENGERRLRECMWTDAVDGDESNGLRRETPRFAASVVCGILVGSLALVVSLHGQFANAWPTAAAIVVVMVAALSAAHLPSGLSIAYIGLLLVGFAFSADKIRSALVYVSPSLRDNLPINKAYAVDCRLWWHVITDKLDIFILSHLFGYVGKAVAIRNGTVLWATSILWEITELCLSGLLPNFHECWWDAIILDVLLCNGLGIIGGLHVCRWFSVDFYNWSKFTPSGSKQMKRFALLTRYLAILTMIVFLQIVDLNIFLLKHILLVPTSHPFVIARQAFCCVLAIPAMREYYQLIVERRSLQPPLHLTACIVYVTLEFVLCLKIGDLAVGKSISPLQAVSWILSTAIASIISVSIFLFQNKCKCSSTGRVAQNRWLGDDLAVRHELKSTLATPHQLTAIELPYEGQKCRHPSQIITPLQSE